MRQLSFVSSVALSALLFVASAAAQDSRPTSRPSPEQAVKSEAIARGRADQASADLAEKVMSALGGRENWEKARYFTWRFFGSRRHFWDKTTGNIRVESKDRKSGKELVCVMNLVTKKGKASLGGEMITGEEELEKILEQTEAAWINDSYWVFMPYKLRDAGVILTYDGKGKTSDGAEAEVLELRFESVGRTPQNRYLVYVDAAGLVAQWDYFATFEDEKPRMSTPWRKWEDYGGIKLSADRGDDRAHSEMQVFDDLPVEIFLTLDPVPAGILSKGRRAPPVGSEYTIEMCAFLEGTWRTKGLESTTEEHWLPAAGKAMLGVSRTYSGERMFEFEYLRIVQRSDGVYYVAQPGGRPPTEFRLVKADMGVLRFENPQHDFPRTISYVVTPAGTLDISLDGEENGKPQHMSFGMTR